MGVKRPFDDEEFQELRYKHSRQLDVRNKLAQFQELVPCNSELQNSDISGEDGGGFHKHQWHREFENGTNINEFAHSVEKDSEKSAALSWDTSSSSEEDVGSVPTPYTPLSLEHFGFDFPQRKFVPFQESCSSHFDCSPKKQVPLGPNHQASIPSWSSHTKNISDGKARKNENNTSNHPGSDNIVDNEDEEKLMGTCIIPMPDPDYPVHNNYKVGNGITDCRCLDGGSIRCVQKHIKEAREELWKSLGHENFVKLGFCDMGEVVSCKWSEEEEHFFHDAVYSNPASLGRNFWRHLSALFPSRTKKEIVSYYFNVFILWKRAIQNRSYSLDIDSDDDEWHESHEAVNEVQASEEDEDSVVESPDDEDEQADSEKVCSDEDDDGDDSDGDVGYGSEEATKGCCGMDYISKEFTVKSSDRNGFDSVVPDVDTIPGGATDGLNIKVDLCTSFEFQPDMADSCSAVDVGHSLQVTGVKMDKCLHSKLEYNDLVDQVNLLDACDPKVWDGRYPSPMKGVDLLPTCNIIEEIFGQGAWDTKTRYD